MNKIPTKGIETRQRERAALRRLGTSVLGRLLKLPRRTRRMGGRAYGNASYRDTHKLPTPTRHRYQEVHLNHSVREWLRGAGA